MTDTATPDPIPVCPRCNRPHITRTGAQACSGHRSNGDPCSKFPIRGGRVCDTHGGRAPQVRRAANEALERVEYQRRAAAALVSVGTPARPDEHPIDGLLREIALSAQAVEYWANAIAELELPDPVNDTGPLADVVGVNDEGEPILRQPYGKLYGRTHQGDLGVHPLVKLWNEERDRHAVMCERAIKAGISERLVRMAETQGTQIATILIAVIDALELSDEQRRRARSIAADKLRALTTHSVIDATAR